jgi:hypothetical protein
MAHFNRRIGITASALGVLLGLSGMFNHGLFEILQGNTSTNGFFIEAIGENHRFWVHGTEAAFTLIHNFLVTGIFAVLTGLAVVFWSLRYIHVKHGATVFLLLLIMLTLVGGGIGFIILFLPTWAFATRINKPLTWWRRKLSVPLIKSLSAIWVYVVATTIISWLIVMELGIFGYFPGQEDPDTILNIVFIFLFSTVILASASFICAIAGDIEEQRN